MTSDTGADRGGDFDLEQLAESYRRDGFVRVRSLLTPEETSTYRAEARRVLSEHDLVRWDGADTTRGAIMEYLGEAHLSSRPMAQLAVHPRVAEVAHRLVGTALRLFTLEVLFKHRPSAETSPHLDSVALPFSTAESAVTAWIALVDVRVESGCLTFVPGSHLLPPPPADCEVWEGAFTRPGEEWMPRVTVPLRAGDATFHHSRVVHGAGANTTDLPRISTSAVYMDAEARFRSTGVEAWDAVPGLHTPLTEGETMERDRFPLLGRS